MATKEYKLKDLLVIKNGKDYKNLLDGSVPVYGTGGVMTYVNDKLYSGESILLPRKGSLENITYVNGDFWTVDTMYWSIVNETIAYPKYLYLYLSLLDLSKKDSGSTLPSMTFDSYYSVPVKLPSKEKQKEIANFIFQIIGKIEKNNEIIKELESMSKTLYDYWFLQFDFPNDEGKPYQSSGGEMIWNSKLNRKIPLGWEIDKLKNITSIALGGTPSRSKKEYWENGTINWLNSGEISNFPIVTSNEKITLLGLENSSTEYMEKGTVVISITGNIRVSILGINSCANQSVVGISESDLYKKEYIFPAISMLIDQFNRISTGNCQQHINKRTLEQSYTLIPPEHILRKYYQEVELMYNEIINNAHQNFELSELRDFLSPLLLNGQVIIK